MHKRRIFNKAIDLGFSIILLSPIIAVILSLFRNGYEFFDIHSINWGIVFEGYTWCSDLPSFNAVLNIFKNAGIVSAGNISYAFFCFGFNVIFFMFLRLVFFLVGLLFSFPEKMLERFGL